jgi:prepilin-type processing-associated H-X9-DG protein
VNGSVDGIYHGGRSGMGHERHGAGSHVAFLDGHVAFMSAERFENVMRAEPRHLVQVQRPIIWPGAVPPEAVRE